MFGVKPLACKILRLSQIHKAQWIGRGWALGLVPLVMRGQKGCFLRLCITGHGRSGISDRGGLIADRLSVSLKLFLILICLRFGLRRRPRLFLTILSKSYSVVVLLYNYYCISNAVLGNFQNKDQLAAFIRCFRRQYRKCARVSYCRLLHRSVIADCNYYYVVRLFYQPSNGVS